MTTSKNGRLIYVYKLTLGSRGRAENEPMTITRTEKMATNHNRVYQKVNNQSETSGR